MVLGKGGPTVWMIVGQGPIPLAVGAGGGCLEFLLSSLFSPLSPCLRETARYGLKYCLKGPLSSNQPTKNPIFQLRRINKGYLIEKYPYIFS